MRADAQQNRERILVAARDVLVELGPGAPLEEISRRAGTGIATLYRRFPDRQVLIREVVLAGLARIAEEARLAAEEESDAFQALTRYMHRALDIRLASVIPALLEDISPNDEEIRAANEPGVKQIHELIDAAKQAGSLRPDVTFGDIGTLVVRLSRPLPGSVTREANTALGHRHLDLLINGLRAASGSTGATENPAITVEDPRSAGKAT